MKTTIVSLTVLLTGIYFGLSQGFANMDFENPFLPLTPVDGQIPTSSAIPNWTAYYSDQISGSYSPADIWYDSRSLGGAFISLSDTNSNNSGPSPIAGSYSIFLQGSIASTPTAASIGQTGKIPISAQSMTFFADIFGDCQITFNGQIIPFSTIGNGINYTFYGADISSYAGQAGQLLFTALPGTSLSGGNLLLDNIQFSSSPIPEPSTLCVGTLGALLLGYRRLRRTR